MVDQLVNSTHTYFTTDSSTTTHAKDGNGSCQNPDWTRAPNLHTRWLIFFFLPPPPPPCSGGESKRKRVCWPVATSYLLLHTNLRHLSERKERVWWCNKYWMKEWMKGLVSLDRTSTCFPHKKRERNEGLLSIEKFLIHLVSLVGWPSHLFVARW